MLSTLIWIKFLNNYYSQSPTLAIDDAVGDESDVVLLFTVTLTAVSAQPITVTYQTADLTATAPFDYTPISGTLTFAPGELTQIIQVPLIGDELDELNETFAINLSNPINVTIADGQAIGTILDDDKSVISYSLYLPFITK